MNRDFQDRIDDYILGRMSAEDRALFEAEVSQDEAKRQQLEFTQNLKRAITSREAKMAMMANMRARYEAESTHNDVSMMPTDIDSSTQHISMPRRLLSKRTMLWISSIAAVFVIGMFMMPQLLMPDTNVGGVSSPIIRGDEDEIFDGDVIEVEEPVDSLQRDSVEIDNKRMRHE